MDSGHVEWIGQGQREMMELEWVVAIEAEWPGEVKLEKWLHPSVLQLLFAPLQLEFQ